jgi:beta-lactamase class A
MSANFTRRTALVAAAAASVRAVAGETSDPVSALEASTGGRIGLCGLNTGTGASIGHRADERFAFCSTFKLLAVAAILKRSEVEATVLERRVHYTEEDLVNYSPVTGQHAGEGMTVAALCAGALQYSDNTAANLITGLLGGPDAVTAFARSIGDDRFRLDRLETALNTAIPGDLRDTATPAAMMADLSGLALGNLLAAPQRDQLVTWMRGSRTGAKRIRAAVPADWVVADKTGSGDYGTANDIAVLWPPGKAALVLTVYSTREKQDAALRDDTVAEAAKLAIRALI